MSTQQVVMEKLERMEKEIHEIKEHMADRDSIMTEEDYEALLAYRKEKAAGKLISHDQLKKELRL